MSKIDDDFAKQPDEIRLGYFARAVNWYMEHGKGQPSLHRVKQLAATLWWNDEFVKPRSKKNEHWSGR